MVAQVKNVQEFTEIRRLQGAAPLNNFLHRKLKLPRSWSNRVVRGLKHASNPGQMMQRREVARAIQPQSPISESLGYLTFDPESFPGLDGLVTDCSAIFDKMRARHQEAELRQGANKEFLISIAQAATLADHPRIFDFMISRPILDLASAYMGAVPVLSWADLWWTPPNNSETKSTLYHCDGEDTRQIKVFVNISNVAEDSGPLTLLSAADSTKIKTDAGYARGRLSDEEVVASGGTDAPVRLIGPPGSGGFVDTSRCLHYGSRHNSIDRLVLMFQYTSFLAPMGRNLAWADTLAGRTSALDPLQRLALNLR